MLKYCIKIYLCRFIWVRMRMDAVDPQVVSRYDPDSAQRVYPSCTTKETVVSTLSVELFNTPPPHGAVAFVHRDYQKHNI